MKPLTNAELRQAINDTVKNLKPYINGFGHKITVLDEDSITILRSHLFDLQQEEARRASAEMAVEIDNEIVDEFMKRTDELLAGAK